MRVFVTGATGFIGSSVVQELLKAGHSVLGLCRSEEKAAALSATGAQAHRGSLEDLRTLADGAAGCDGVIHLAFNHEVFNDFSKFAESGTQEQRAIEALGAALQGSQRPLIVTSGTGLLSPGRIATEQTQPQEGANALPRNPEAAAALIRSTGTNVSIVRLPQVHDTRRQGLVTRLIAIAQEKGYCAYIGDGLNRWPAAHRLDVVRLYRLALEQAKTGAVYHAVGEQGIALKEIAMTLGKRLGLPVKSLTTPQAEGYFGWLAAFAAADIPTSSEWTQRTLQWRPTGPGLIADLEQLELAPG